jgi:pilus assembly protein Flp/PilA
VLNTFIRDETGATAVEYGIIVAVLSVTIIGGIGNAMEAVRWLWSDTNSELSQSFD